MKRLLMPLILLFSNIALFAQPKPISLVPGVSAVDLKNTASWIGSSTSQVTIYSGPSDTSLNTNGQVNIGGLNGVYIPLFPGISNGNLTVDGTVLCNRVKIAVPNGANWNWADYVFEKKYKLKPLNEVANFIKENKHLEGIPTSVEVSKNGVDLAPVTAKLLEKIEELTLYMIEKDKQISELIKKSKAQQIEIAALKKKTSL